MLRLLAAIACAALACGTQETKLTDEDVDAIRGTLVVMMAPARVQGTTRSSALTLNIPVDWKMACPAAGNVATHGTVTTVCGEGGSCTVSAAVNLDFGNAANAFDDCEYSNRLIVHGSLLFTQSGDEATVSGNVDGVLKSHRRGPTGGLLDLEDCTVQLVALSPQGTVTGSICGRAVTTAW